MRHNRFLLYPFVLLIGLLSSCQLLTPPHESEGQYVNVNGKRLWYRIEGQGSPLLVVAGGPGLSHTYLWPHFSVFAKDFKVIYFDTYGTGKSDRSSDPNSYSFSRDVDEIEGLRQALNLGKINLYGHCYGGMVAQGYALKYGQFLNHLVLTSALHSGEMWQKGNNDMMNLHLQNQMPELWARLQQLRAQGRLSCDPEYQKIEGEMPFSYYFYNPSNAEIANYSGMDLNLDVYSRIAGPDADVILGGDLASLDFRPRLKDIKVPTLILMGRFDRIAIPKYAIQFRQFMPQATFVTFEKSGHCPFIEEAARHEMIVTHFLKGLAIP
jgi:proline iminopeptidase